MVADIDKYDRNILEIIQRDAMASVAELGEKVGLSQSTCWRRVNLLDQAGVIRSRVALLDPKVLGLEILVFANVKLSGHGKKSLSEFEGAVTALPQVLECHMMSGESDYLLRIVAEDVAGYDRFLRETLLQLPGVAEIHSQISLSEVKFSTALPLPELAK